MPDTILTCQSLDNDKMTHAYTSELIIRSTAPTKLKLQIMTTSLSACISLC